MPRLEGNSYASGVVFGWACDQPVPSPDFSTKNLDLLAPLCMNSNDAAPALAEGYCRSLAFKNSVDILELDITAKCV